MASNFNANSSEEERKKKAEEDKKKLTAKGQRLDIFVYTVDLFRTLTGL